MDADDLVSLNLAIAADEQRYAACPLEYERAAGWHIEDYWRVRSEERRVGKECRL